MVVVGFYRIIDSLGVVIHTLNIVFYEPDIVLIKDMVDIVLYQTLA